MHHAAEDHVVEGIDPERSQHEEDKSRAGHRGVEGRFDTHNPCDTRDQLPCSSHYQDPAEALAVVERLEDMAEDGEAKKHAE